MRYINLISSLSLVSCLAALSGCATTPAPDRPARTQEVRIETAPVIVATGCLPASGLPDAPRPLRQEIPQDRWDAMPPGAKAEAVKAKAGERLNYEDAVRAATAGCQ
jgi:hypothetical protein